MKKIIYIYSRIENDLETSGEAKKANMQIDAFKKNGLNAEIVYHDRTHRLNKLFVRLPFYKIYNKTFIENVTDHIDSETIGLYIRKDIIDASFIAFLKKIKEQYQIKIVIEIPTFPYDKEWNSIKDFPMLLKDRKNRKKMFRFADKVVVYGNEQSVFHIPCINSSNGIDVTKIKKRTYKKTNDGKINLLGVAGLAKWHGYDRLINGLADYYKKDHYYDVLFHIVGGGSEKKHLEKLVKKLKIKDKVFFYGEKKGAELEQFFNHCDIGIGSLGMSRIGLKHGYTLKLREYAARGIPFIYAYDDHLIESSGIRFYKKYKNNESAINVDTLVRFYMECKDKMKEIADDMSEIAQKSFTWEVQLKPIADYFLSEGYSIC